MDPGLGLQPTVSVGTLDLDGHRLDPRLFAGGLFQELHTQAVGVGPARVHAQEHSGPVAGLRSASAGIDLQEGVVAVRLAGEQGLEFGAARPLADGLQLASGLLQAGFIALLVGEFGISDRVRKVPLKGGDGVY